MMVVRANALTWASASPPVMQMLVDLLNNRITPVVQSRGTLGEADLVQIENLEGTMVGKGECYYKGVRMPAADLGDHFLAEQKRSVQKDRTVTLDGVAFEVDAALVGERVTLRFDPARRPDKRTVEVWHQGRRIEIARRVDVLANCFIKRNGTTKNLEMPTGATVDVPEGMAMRDLVGDDDAERDLF